MFSTALLLLFLSACKKDLNYISKSQQRFLITTASTSSAVNYYVDPSSTLSKQDGSVSAPWKTIEQVNSNMDLFKPGDKINFKRGQRFKGPLIIYRSGTSSAPITFSTYGSGTSPLIEYDLNTTKSVGDRMIIDVAKAQYVVLDGFNLTDAGMSTTNHSTNARVGTGINLGNSSFITVKNMQMSLMGIGISVKGNNNSISYCSFTNMRMIINDATSDNDYGANGIVLSGSGNSITNNTFRDNWASSHDYVYDGGAIEFFGPYSNNKIMYNTCINNEGFMEFGSKSGGYGYNNLVAYNLLINNGQIFWFNLGGKFALSVSNLQFYNNNVIETKMDRKNSSYLIAATLNTVQPPNMLIMKNNIIWTATSVKLARSWSNTSFIHANNIYRMATGILEFPLSSSELSITLSAPLFKDISSSKPSAWDYNLVSSSVAIDKGAKLGLTLDLEGKVVFNGKAPEIGALEYYP